MRTPQAKPPAAAAKLPAEVVFVILSNLVVLSRQAGARALLLNRTFSRRLEPLVYAQVELGESDSIAAFARTMRERPDVARMVRRIWIGPMHARSDLLAVLSPESPSDSNYVLETREQVFVDTRFILRACRRLVDVALASLLVSNNAVHSYGTACQPLRLTSINPHSFICGFGAPIFRRVVDLNVFDINLSHSEAEGICKLRKLKHLQLVSPKDYGEINRDVLILQKILSIGPSLEDSIAQMSLDTPDLTHVVVRSASQRADQVVNAVRGRTCVAVEAEHLTSSFIDEWDSLRDLVFDANEDYERAALDDVGAWADPGNALATVLQEWRSYPPVKEVRAPSA